MEITEFQETVWSYYAKHVRDLPWRHSDAAGRFNAYNILVSEIMLQQTQASRVIPKYISFLEKFPSLRDLAVTPLSAVLAEWNGLGYNRRAKYLHLAASSLAFQSEPWKLEDLTACKGIGPNTAAAVLVYAYDRPLAFIETNIRTVFIHHFFADKAMVDDKDILPLVEETLDREHPRQWFWALMDYGVHLKAASGNASRASRHYTKQTAFHGSKRQIRGQVLRELSQGQQTGRALARTIPDDRLKAVLSDLQKEELITFKGDRYHLG